MSEQPSSEFVLYMRNDEPAIDLRLDSDTIVLTQEQIAGLFGKAKFTIDEHIKNVKNWLAHLRQLLSAMGCKVLKGAGKVSYQQTVAHSETEYASSGAQFAEHPSEVESDYLEAVKMVQKKIPGKRKP